MSDGDHVTTDLIGMENIQQFARTGLPVRVRRQAQINSWVLKGDMIFTAAFISGMGHVHRSGHGDDKEVGLGDNHWDH